MRSEQTSIEKGKNSNPKINNIFLVKQNSSGNREWIMDLGISDDESEISMTFDSSDNVYVTRYKEIVLKAIRLTRFFSIPCQVQFLWNQRVD